jgi:hypothetical protein
MQKFGAITSQILLGTDFYQKLACLILLLKLTKHPVVSLPKSTRYLLLTIPKQGNGHLDLPEAAQGGLEAPRSSWFWNSVQKTKSATLH